MTKAGADTSIVTQAIHISYFHAREGNEGLIYTTSRRADAPPPEPATRRVRWQSIRRYVDDVREQVETLNVLARNGKPREGSGIEAAAAALGANVLPERGFSDLLEPGTHPQLDIVTGPAGQIPWEVLDDRYYVCEDPDHPPVRLAGSSAVTNVTYCTHCGQAMRAAGGRLALAYHLTHLVRGGASSPSTGGGEFLLILDPLDDLCQAKWDRTGRCRSHLVELQALLERHGYVPNLIPGRNATVRHVRDALKNPQLVGIYYFGHGDFPRNGDQGCLLLADGPLFASEIKAASPSAKLIFLNACQGAAEGGDRDVEARPGGVAQAFAQGGGKVVIAPLWPIVSVHAAEMALAFFREASMTSALGRALQRARQASFERYERGEPELGWAAYRYFGDPSKRLPAPGRASVGVGRKTTTTLPCRIFDAAGQLDTDVFAFAVDEALLRAAKRRNLQKRTRVTVTDFLAGLVRRGDLTRFVLRELGVDPDRLYDELGERVEPALPGEEERTACPSGESGQAVDEASNAEAARELLAQWIIRERRQLDERLVRVLVDADERAQRRAVETEGLRISEQDVLESFIAGGLWGAQVPVALPPASAVSAMLRQRDRQGRVDENGRVVLAGLDSSARRVIEAAHVLAQQGGVCPITNRLLLAAFLTESDGYAATVCRRAQLELEPELLAALMIAATEQQPPRSFGLSPEACERVVTPVLEGARLLAPASGMIGDRELFKAFSQHASPAFKEWLREPPLGVDLDALASLNPDEIGPEVEPPPRATDDPRCDAPSGRPGRRNEGPTDSSPPGEDGIHRSQFDPSAWAIVLAAARLAQRLGWTEIRTPHLFAALIGDGSGPAAPMFERGGIEPGQGRALVLSLVPSQRPQSVRAPALSDNTLAILRRSIEIAGGKGRGQATGADILTAFFADGGGVVGETLARLGLGPLASEPRDAPESFSARPRDADQTEAPRTVSVLGVLGRDLTEKARRGELPAIVGRDREIDSAIQTLLLMESANPLLVGEAGVGKTAIVEGIAARIAAGRCPKKLRSTRIVELSAGSLVANTRLRGEFEQRVQAVLAEARGDVVLFIDEIHTIVGAGLGEGGGPDAGNMLKAALARGEVKLIGATTFAEYRRTIAKDKALARRFQVQSIGPPSREATLQILSARQSVLERHHDVRILDAAKVAAVDLSGRYILDKQWPAKARDALERACVLAATDDDATAPGGASTVTPEHVARVVARQTGIPVERVSAGDLSALATLSDRIRMRIVGQDAAVQTIVDAIRRGRQGLGDWDRPWGVFLFVGPPGVGKTELAKVLAEEVYGGPEGLIRFDMGDFTEPHSTARLIGAPPGYVGYDQGAPLIERLRGRPYSLVLFDEVEHAHENVLAVLLRLLADGTLADSDGNIADARNAIVIMTSNLAGSARGGGRVGFTGSTETQVGQRGEGELRALLERRLPSNLVDRLDAVIGFHPLAGDDLRAIASQRIAEVVERAAALYGITVEVGAEVAAWIAARTEQEGRGARDIQREVDEQAGSVLSATLMSLASSGLARVTLTLRGDGSGLECGAGPGPRGGDEAAV